MFIITDHMFYFHNNIKNPKKFAELILHFEWIKVIYTAKYYYLCDISGRFSFF